MEVVNTGTFQVIELTDEPVVATIKTEAWDRYSLRIEQGSNQVLVFMGNARHMMAIMSAISFATWE